MGQPDLTEAEDINQKAVQLIKDRKYADAIPLAQRALELRERALGPEHPVVATTLYMLATLYGLTGDGAKAEALYQRALAIREKALGPAHPDVAQSLNSLAELYRVTGAYTKAEAFYQQALAILEKALGPDHAAVMKTLYNLAEMYRATGAYAKAEPLYHRALAILEKALGPEDPAVATMLDHVAALYRDMAAYSKAEALYRRGLAIRKKALGPEHPAVAATLHNLAELYRATGAYAKAEPLYHVALAIYEKAFGPEHPEVATVLHNLAASFDTTGQYAKAEPLYQRALVIEEKALGPDHLAVAATLYNLAHLYQTTGAYAKAEPPFQRALAIREKARGPMHPEVADTLNQLALLYDITGEYAKAEPLFQRALTIREKALGPAHPNVGATLHNLATLYYATGEYAKAEPLYQRALAILEKALGPDHIGLARMLNSLGLLYKSTGDYTKAAPLFQRALAIREKGLGPEHPEVANGLNNLAALYERMGAYSSAEPLYQRALAILEKAKGLEHPHVANVLHNLAALYGARGVYTKGRDKPNALTVLRKAEPLYQRALAIWEKALGPDHLAMAATLDNLAALYRNTGAYARAEPLFQRSLTIREKALGPEHPDVVFVLSNQAVMSVLEGRYKPAADLFVRIFGIEDRQIQNVFTFTLEPDKLQFIEFLSGNLNSYLSLVNQYLGSDRAAVNDALSVLLRRKGVVFDAQSRAQEALRGRLSETARKDFDQLSALRSELARLLLNKPEKMSADTYKEKLNSLQQQIEATERHLAGESALVAKELQQRKITVEAVAKQVPRNSALVEFAKITDANFAKAAFATTQRYLAFILTQAGDVTLVDLGDAAALEALAARVSEDLRLSVKSGGRQPMHVQQSLKSLGELYSKIWAPIEKSLGPVEKVLLSPDGALNLVPFATLMDADGKPLLERYRLAYVSSGRELVGADTTAYKPESDLLLVANPTYDLNAQKLTASVSDPSPKRSRDFRGHFGALPGTDREANDIPPLVAGDEKRKQVVVGSKATERAVKTARSPRILHLATHGFFLQDEAAPPDLDTRGRLLQTDRSRQPQTTARRSENPLLRSGLAFAGANNAVQVTEGDDGLLTALEITGMDLYGTELVVLSACETAVGEVKTGEGVFGLRRAFALAGAKNLMMSLWPVDDETTARQMKAFYQNLQKLPPAEALRQAQLETIRELKAEFPFPPPALWAPFILQGAHALGK